MRAGSAGLSPWTLTEKDGRYYGRGVVDNKGQHTINIAAQAAVIAERGKLGFNAKWLIEMGEETGSPGLRELCAEHKDLFKADVLVGSDGPRLTADRPTISLGTRGAFPIDIWIDAREGGHHSGNWGGLLSSPAIQLVHALSTITGPTGQIRIPEWVPADGIPDSVKRALADCEVKSGPGDPEIDPNWAEPGLTLAEKVFAWCTFRNSRDGVGRTRRARSTRCRRAPGRAGKSASWSAPIRTTFLPALRRHLDRHGFPMVQIAQARDDIMMATRLDPEHPWARWAATSIAKTTNKKPAVLPNVGGSLPNDIFSEGLGLPTDLGAALLSRLLAACAERAFPRSRSRAKRSASWRGFTGIWASPARREHDPKSGTNRRQR